MPSKNSSTVMLDVNAGSPAEQTSPVPMEAAPGDPFRVLILGDFSGSEYRPALAARKPVRVDRDNFDDVLRKMNPRVDALKLSFTELADFEPDSIFRRCEAFQNTTPAARVETASAPAETRAPIQADVERLTSGSLLDDIIGQSDEPAAGRARPRDEMQSLVERVVAPHLAPREDPSVANARQKITQAHQALMRAILHHGKFQALEAVWRALDLLVRGLNSEDGLSIHILDVTKQEAAEDLEDDHGRLYRVVVEETAGTPGGQRWAILIGNYAFDRSEEDIAMLARLAGLARGAGAPFLAEAEPPADGDNARWSALRAHRDARWLGLALPRFLGRLPYGPKTYAVESFPFEEIEGPPNHADLLWLNPAFACALLLGRSYNDQGWAFRAGADREISGMPYYTFEREGETVPQPCAEILLTDSEIDYLQGQGLMALASIKNRDAVFLMRFQSIAEPLAGLAGRWRPS